MALSPQPEGGRYDWFGWRVAAVPPGVVADRLVETHKYFHRQREDTTAFGGLTRILQQGERPGRGRGAETSG